MTASLIDYNWLIPDMDLNRAVLVGVAGFEPTTPCPPDKCATRLRYTPTVDLADAKSNRHISRCLHFGKALSGFFYRN